MSDETEEEAAAPVASAAKAKVPVLPLLLGIVLSVVLSTAAIGGGMYWAVKSGHLPLAGMTVTKVEVVEAPPPAKTKLIPLEPLLINLADPDGRAYLRVALTLKVEDPPPAKGAKPKEEKAEKGGPKNEFDAEERDAAFGILGKETAAQLLEPDGKERLKKDLIAELKVRVPDVKVQDVLITEFLVQR
jgi:flagellar FliL protein